MKEKKKISTREIVLIGLMVASIEAVKIPLSVIPGVELVSLLMVLYTLVFGQRLMYYGITAFVILEGILHGFGIWWFMYMYSWPLLAFLTHLLRKNQSLLIWSGFLAIYGLCYGALCSIPYYFAGGIGTAVTWWVRGIPVDILHGLSNFVVCFVLFKPLQNILQKSSKTAT